MKTIILENVHHLLVLTEDISFKHVNAIVARNIGKLLQNAGTEPTSLVPILDYYRHLSGTLAR